MLFEKRGLYGSAKSIDSGQPAHTTPADLGRNVFANRKFSQYQGSFLPYHSVGYETVYGFKIIRGLCCVW